MDRKNDEIFSPIKDSDEKEPRHSDSFSKFLEGPDAFKVSSICTKTEENIDEKTPSTKSILSEESLKNESSSSEASKDEVSPSSTCYDAFLSCLESSCSLKKVDKSDNLIQSGSTKNEKDFSSTLAVKYDKREQITGQQSEAQCRIEHKLASNLSCLQLCSNKKSLQASATVVSEEIKKTDCPTSLKQHNILSQLHSVEKSEADAVSVVSGSKETQHPSSLSQQNPSSPQLLSVQSSVQSQPTVASEASGSKELKKPHLPSSLSQPFNQSSEIQSKIEKMVADAVESKADNIQQLMWSQHYDLSKSLHETKETLEADRASVKETLSKIMEELAEENRQLHNAAFGHE